MTTRKQAVLLIVVAGLVAAAGYAAWKSRGEGDEFVVSGVIEADRARGCEIQDRPPTSGEL